MIAFPLATHIAMKTTIARLEGSREIRGQLSKEPGASPSNARQSMSSYSCQTAANSTAENAADTAANASPCCICGCGCVVCKTSLVAVCSNQLAGRGTKKSDDSSLYRPSSPPPSPLDAQLLLLSRPLPSRSRRAPDRLSRVHKLFIRPQHR